MVDHAGDHGQHEIQPFRLERRSGVFALRRSRSWRLRRLCLAAVTLILTFCLFGALAAGLMFLRLSQGPVVVSLERQVAEALSARVRHGFTFTIGSTEIRSVEGRPALTVRQLRIADEAGRAVIRAPEATISVDPLRLLGGEIVPTRLDIRDVTLKLSILPDGDVALSAGSDEVLPFRIADAFESTAPGPHAEASSTNDAAQPSAANVSSADPLARFAAVLAPLIDKFTGADDALGGFDRLGVTRGVLVLDDRTHNTVRTFRDLAFDFERSSLGGSQVTVAADGAAGRWSVSARGVRTSDGRRMLDVSAGNVTLEDLQVVPGMRDPGFDADVPVSASLTLELDQAATMTAANGHLAVGQGFVRLNDPDHEPLMVTGGAVDVRFDPKARRFDLPSLTVDTETMSYRLAGQIAPPTADRGIWGVSAAGSGIFGAERPGEKPIPLDRIDLNAAVDPAGHRLAIDRLAIAGPEVAVGLKADIRWGENGLHVDTTASAGRMSAPVLMRLWPTTISAQVRAWLLKNLQAGVVERGVATIALDEADLAKMKQMRSVADGHLRLDYAVSGVTLGFLDGVPPLRNLAGTGVVTGDTSSFNVSQSVMEVSPGRRLALTDGGIAVPSTDPRPTPAVITAHVVGGVDVLAELLARDALKGFAALPPESANAKGQIDGLLTVELALGAGKTDGPKIGANARISGLAIEKLVGRQNLTDGTIALVLDKFGLKAEGKATILGAPSTIDIRKPAGTGPGEANVVLTLDDAARAKAGFDLGRSVAGPVTAKIATVLGGPDKKAAIEIDLTRVAINNLVPGLSKPAGKAAKVTLVATQRDTGVDLDAIACDIGAFSVRGSADLDANGSFRSAKLTQLRLSPGDDLKADIAQNGDGLKMTLRGTNLDARPFLKNLTGPDQPDTNSKDLDVDLHANLLTGNNSQVLTGADLKLSRRNGQIRKLQMSGRFGRAPLAINSTAQGNVLAIVATSADAGASLAFLDLYKKVSGGALETNIRMMGGRMEGTAVIHEFSLREDPAMKKLTAESMSRAKNADVQIDAGNLSFTKLAMQFSKSGSKVDIKDGAIFGPQLGATVRGTLDFTRDRVALSGTFVPLYGVNNLFSQIPLVGPILGGGAHEGLFALNYKITGSPTTPDLTVDPLSALAPGIFRNIFGAITQGMEQGAQAGAGAGESDASAR